MTERQLQFRVGLFTLVSMAAAVFLVFQFGELRSLWEPTYRVNAVFNEAPGVYPGTPVKTNGLDIGAVEEVRLGDAGGVVVGLAVRKTFAFKADARVTLSRGLLGDACIDVSLGRADEPLPAGKTIVAVPYSDPMDAVARLEGQVVESLAAIRSTSEEWRRVGTNMNALMDTNSGNINVVVERAAASLAEFGVAMKSLSRSAEQAGALVGDPENTANLKRTLAALPSLVEETSAAIAAAKTATEKADESLANLAEATGPLADRSASIATRLDSTLANLEVVSGELRTFSNLLADEDGTLHRLAADPSLYRNLDRSAESLSVLLANLDPVLRDVRVFTDKIARHPEVMGLGGALAPSDGTKTVEPAGYQQPASDPRAVPSGSAARAGGATQRR